MKLPSWPSFRPLSRITPTLYNLALICPAKALWSEFGERGVFISGPTGILGIAFHAVLEDAGRGALPAEAEQRNQAAAYRYDTVARDAWICSHPLLRWRYGEVENIPFYYTRRAEAIDAVSGFCAPSSKPSTSVSKIEWSVSSRDSVIQGRIDYVNENRHFVVDYKSGRPPDDQAVSDPEARQLRLYAYLCAENGIEIRTGVIIRRGNRRDELEIPPAEARDEAGKARELLAELNRRIAIESILELAAPSAENCRFCSCRPICDAFWRNAVPSWASSVGHCAEARVESVTRKATPREAMLALDTINLRGTVSPGPCRMPPFPAAIAEADGSPPPPVGATLRILDAMPEGDSNVLRPMQYALTSVWSVPSGTENK